MSQCPSLVGEKSRKCRRAVSFYGFGSPPFFPRATQVTGVLFYSGGLLYFLSAFLQGISQHLNHLFACYV